MVLIGGLQKSSLIDYPEKISAIIFTQGCNFRCPYCHNPELLNFNINETDSATLRPLREKVAERRMRGREVIDFLKTRVGKLDAVVISGGEPTLHKDLPELIQQIKDLGFLVKLDTNGTNPEMLEKLIDENLVDYVAMDIKAPIEKYSEVVCTKVNTENILKSIEILKKSNIDYEFRTTVVKSQLSPDDFEKIGEIIEGVDKYYLQKFVSTKTIDENFLKETTYLDEDFEKIAKDLQKFASHIIIR